MAAQEQFEKDVDFSTLQRLLEDEANPILLVDVRTPGELRTDGQIPGTVNLPLHLPVQGGVEQGRQVCAGST